MIFPNLNLKNKRLIYFILTFSVIVSITFIKYKSINLFLTGSWDLYLVKYYDNIYDKNENGFIKEDTFVKEILSNKDRLVFGFEAFHLNKLLPYSLEKVIHLSGAQLWLAHKFILSCLGICTVLLFFLIADLFYGPLVGFLSGVMAAFSPHIWIAFNLDGALTRAYNFLLCLLLTYFFLLYIKQKKLRFVIASGIIMGINFLFFHIGSFMIPIIILIFCIYNSFAEKKGSCFRHFAYMLIIALFSAFSLDYFRSWYFNIPFSLAYKWFEIYLSKGPESSHTTHGIVFYGWNRLFLNIKEHIQGVFINGKTSGDWHYLISPPGIPYVYNYFLLCFFLAGCFIAIRRKHCKDIFFFLWFIVFYFVYSFIIVVRQKNILWEVPPIFILAARSAPMVGSFLHKKIKAFSEKNMIICISVVIIASSIGTGYFIIMHKLPKKNYYDGGGSMGTYQLYQYLSQRGYSNKTSIILTSHNILVGNMMLRLLTEDVPQFICLTQGGVSTPPENYLENWLKLELTLKNNSDKIFYCFNYFDNHLGYTYYTDEFYRGIFEKNHPGIIPFELKGLDGGVLWRVYEIID